MGYQELNQYNSKNYTPGNQANSVWGLGPRKVKYITIHWWGNPADGATFEGVINYLSRPNGKTSAHVIAEAGRVAWIVNGTDCAWHAGNAEGNSHSIGIECNPRASNGDYQTIGELVRDIRAIYGNIPLVPHRTWQNTQCPGVYDLGRIDSIARGATAAPAPAPAAPKPAPAPVKQGSGKVPYCTVEKGDTFYGISKQFGVSVAKLAAYNPGVNANSLKIGQRIYLVNYCIVEAGDTGYGIASQMGVSFAQLNAFNPGTDWNALKVGQALWLE